MALSSPHHLLLNDAAWGANAFGIIYTEQHMMAQTVLQNDKILVESDVQSAVFKGDILLPIFSPRYRWRFSCRYSDTRKPSLVI